MSLPARRSAIREHTRFGSTSDRFWRQVDRSGDGCHEWQGARVRGYGRFSVEREEGRTHDPAHRVAWELTFGPIPDGMLVCHRCDNPPYCRVDHLFLGTPKDNVLDREEKGRSRGAPVFSVPARGQRNASAKLTATRVRALRAAYAAGGTTHAELARRFGISPANVSFIVNRRTWAHVD